ncbi:MAG: lipocalin-like domain-containing protein [Dysgonomonas sp.]
MKVYLIVILSFLLVPIFFSCSDDYIENGIEGKWQMTKIVKEDGRELTVDTIFYNFKKGVYMYQRSTNKGFTYSTGLYEEKSDSLYLDIRYGNNPVEWNGDSLRVYKIEKRKSTRMELVYQNDKYLFRKY